MVRIQASSSKTGNDNVEIKVEESEIGFWINQLRNAGFRVIEMKEVN